MSSLKLSLCLAIGYWRNSKEQSENIWFALMSLCDMSFVGTAGYAYECRRKGRRTRDSGADQQQQYTSVT